MQLRGWRSRDALNADPWLTSQEVALYLGMKYETFKSMYSRGSFAGLVSYKWGFGKRAKRVFRKSELDRWIRTRQIKGNRRQGSVMVTAN